MGNEGDSRMQSTGDLLRKGRSSSSSRQDNKSDKSSESEFDMEGQTVVSSQELEELMKNTSKENADVLLNQFVNSLNIYVKDKKLIEKIVSKTRSNLAIQDD